MQRPTSVTVFGILNLIFGALGVCGFAFSLIALSGAMDAGASNPVLEIMERNSAMRIFQNVAMALGSVAIGVKIASGIGLLKLRPWGRNLAIGYAGYAILATIVTVVFQGVVYVPELLQKAAEMDGPQAAVLRVTAFSTVGGGCLGLIYPGLLLYFMLRPHVRAAFQPFPFDDQPTVRPFEETGNPYQSP